MDSDAGEDDEARPYTADEIAGELSWLQARARRIAADHDTAQDLAADVLLSALERPPRRGSLRGWLSAALFHRLINRRRAAERRIRREQRVQRPRATESPTEVVALRERREAVLTAVRELPCAYRDVVSLRYLEGLEPTAIAARLGVPPSTVRTRLARARARLRRDLGRRQLILLPAAWTLLRGRQAYAATAAVAASLFVVLFAPSEPQTHSDTLIVVSFTHEVYPTPIANPSPMADSDGTEALAAVLPR